MTIEAEFGTHRLAPSKILSYEDWKSRNQAMLYRTLNMGTTIAFVGAGCSAPLGYPAWKAFAKKLIEATKVFLCKRDSPSQTSADIRQAERFIRQLSKRSISTHEVLHILDVCRSHFRSTGTEGEQQYLRELAAIFQPGTGIAQRRATAVNPYHALLRLPITRFVTSNYDLELEHALRDQRGIPADELGLGTEPPNRTETPRRSFTQEGEYANELALFAMAHVENAANLVYHCHGRIDRPASMVVTEQDYQRWYLRDQDRTTSAFLQSLYLLFGSNPILFVGFSLDDDDLMRQLRVFTAATEGRPSERPLFLLREEKPAASSRAKNEQLDSYLRFYDRYGVHVVPYDLTVVVERADKTPTAKKTGDKRSQALCEALADIESNRKIWRESWLRKPYIRSIQVGSEPPKAYYHYMPDLPDDERTKYQFDKNLQKELREFAIKNRGVMLVHGNAGTGKTWQVQTLIDYFSRTKRDSSVTARNSGNFAGFFYWSSYYSNDSLSGLERVLAYMEESGPNPPRGSRIERFRELIAQRRYLLVFDGIDRFVPEQDIGSVDRIYTSGSEKFLETMMDPDSRSLIVLTCRQIPKVFHQFTASRFVPTDRGTYAAAGASPQALRSGTTQASPDSRVAASVETMATEAVSLTGIQQAFREGANSEAAGLTEAILALYSLLDGHAYGLSLALQIFKTESDSGKRGKLLDEMRRRLSNTPPDRRVSRMVGLAIDKAALRIDAGVVDPLQDPSKLKESSEDDRSFLEQMALFMTPVRQLVAEHCLHTAADCRRSSRDSADECRRRLRGLIERHLILELNDDAPPRRQKVRREKRFAVHPTVRAYIYRRLHGANSDALPNFTLPGFTAVTAGSDAGSPESVRLLEGLVEHLVAAADEKMSATKQPPAPRTLDEARSLLRAAFTAVRSRMESNTTPRWGTYDRYLRIILRLANAVKRCSALSGPPVGAPVTGGIQDSSELDATGSGVKLPPEGWSHVPPESLTEVLTDVAVLYADELAWLYNEIGLACYSEGNMLDANAVWEQGYDINRIINSHTGGGTYIFQSLCNLGAVNIQIGRLDVAEAHFKKAETQARLVSDHDHAGRIMGYLGLIHQLRGNLVKAESFFDQCFGLLEEAGGNPRAESIFRCHYGDLKLAYGNLDEARRQIQVSQAVADAGRFPELSATARLSYGHWYRQQKEYKQARIEYNASLRKAREIGARRLESQVLIELARLALDEGDLQGGRRLAADGLRIANDLVLGLMQTHGMIVLGIASIRAREIEIGRAYLRYAKGLAERQGYLIRVREAEEHLYQETEQPL
jgi:tetratricopeptide (TPR) repeat protein